MDITIETSSIDTHKRPFVPSTDHSYYYTTHHTKTSHENDMFQKRKIECMHMIQYNTAHNYSTNQRVARHAVCMPSENARQDAIQKSIFLPTVPFYFYALYRPVVVVTKN